MSIGMHAVQRAVRRRLRGDDDGMALVVVVGSMMVLAMFLMVGLTYAVSSTKFSRMGQDYLAAITAAQSGVDDFIARLNRDDMYGRVPDCSATSAMVNPTDCGGADYAWRPVEPSETDPDAAHFHYSVDASRAATQGTIMVTSTGRVNGVYRTIEVAVGKGGSTDYVYYTDFEDADPENTVVYPSGAPNRACGRDGANLANYYYQGRSGCQEIQFGEDDVLDGRVHSNDAILSRGGQFQKGIESPYSGCRSTALGGTIVASNPSTWGACLRSGSTFTATGADATFGVAPAQADLNKLTDNSAEFANHPGCHYYGPTRVKFHGNGTMTVWSASSNFSGAVLAIAPPHGTAPSCGSGVDLASSTGATVAVPDDMVVYAGPAPTSGVGAVPRALIRAGAIGDGLPLGTYTASVPATPTALGQSYTVDANMLDARKYAGEGNLYVEGVVKGRVTLAAAQSIVVTGDIVLAGGDTGTDLVGLVATNSVEVMHPWMKTVSSTRRSVSCGWGCTSYVYEWGNPSGGAEYTATQWPRRIADPARGGVPSPTTGLQISASIQTLQHSFLVQYYAEAPDMGDLFVYGSIAQRWRGIVRRTVTSGYGGTTYHGYAKDYQYDGRLQYSAPPYFPHWVNAQWSLRYSGEVPTPDVLQT